MRLRWSKRLCDRGEVKDYAIKKGDGWKLAIEHKVNQWRRIIESKKQESERIIEIKEMEINLTLLRKSLSKITRIVETNHFTLNLIRVAVVGCGRIPQEKDVSQI